MPRGARPLCLVGNAFVLLISRTMLNRLKISELLLPCAASHLSVAALAAALGGL